MHATLLDTPSFRDSWSQGLSDERKVKAWLRQQGYVVEDSTVHENKYEDIDCYVNGKSVSIKAQHKSLVYGNVGFELAQLLTSHSSCQKSKNTLEAMKEVDILTANNMVDELRSTDSWEDGWLYTGMAEFYLILRGHHLHMYKKTHILSHVERNGWRKIRPLSASVRKTQGGNYRYANTISGYLFTGDVPNRIWDLTQVNQQSTLVNS